MNKEEREEFRQMSAYVVFDLETTGISTRKDAVIEISALKVRDGLVVDEFSTLVDPECPIPAAASQVNHITDEMVCGAPVFQEVLDQFLEFAGNDVLVGHNIRSFDMKFISRDAQKYYGSTVDNVVVDTLDMAKECFPQMSHRRLGDLAHYYGISTEGAHRALKDCYINKEVYERMAEDLKARGDEPAEERICPQCGKSLLLREGRFGFFWGCKGYPRCRYTESA